VVIVAFREPTSPPHFSFSSRASIISRAYLPPLDLTATSSPYRCLRILLLSPELATTSRACHHLQSSPPSPELAAVSRSLLPSPEVCYRLQKFATASRASRRVQGFLISPELTAASRACCHATPSVVSPTRPSARHGASTGLIYQQNMKRTRPDVPAGHGVSQNRAHRDNTRLDDTLLVGRTENPP